MYDFGGSYLDKNRKSEEPNSEEHSRATSLEDVAEILDDFNIIAEDEPDVLRYQRDVMNDINSSGALRANFEFDQVRGTRPKFSDRQLRNVRFETMAEELAQMDPDTILVQVEDPWNVPEGLDEYMKEHGYTRPLAGFSPKPMKEDY